MNIADCFVSHIADNPLNALSDDRTAKMAYMKGFCHIWTAIVNNYLQFFVRLFYPEFGRYGHFR